MFSNSLGHCTKFKVHLYLKKDSKPVFRPKRPVPYAKLNIVDEELERLISGNIITQANYSEYAAPIVCPHKSNGTVRICGDYSTGLNENLEPHPYPLPTPEEIFVKISHGVKFANIDLSDAYLQTEVDAEARKLLTINTHRGLFHFNRLPPGVKSAPGAFQEIMDKMLMGIEGTAVYIDDIICAATDNEKLYKILCSVLERLEEFGFHLKKEKCSFFQDQVKYLGHLINKSGIKPDPEKIKAIVEMPSPINKSQLGSLLGSINYYVKFVPSMRNLRALMDFLMKKDAEFVWSNECQESFDKFKQILSSDLLLTHFNPKLPIIIAGDASNVGIGAVIYHQFQDGSQKAIYHVSRALTTAESNYSQIEKEGLALIFAVKRFHRFIFGRKFTLMTDHKPLLAIFGSKKGIPIYTANRLQRWALILIMYDFDIKYTSTSEFGHADILSRLIKQVEPDQEYIVASIRFEQGINRMAEQSTASLPVSFEMITQETQKCPILKQIMQFVSTNWPEKKNIVLDSKISEFYSRKEALSIVSESLFFLDRIVVPEKYQKLILKQMHKGHPGMERMKSIARSYVYWPKIDKHIENFVKDCNNCALAAKSPTKTTLQSWPIPSKPWERLHIDYAGPVKGNYFLVVVDAHSKWPEIFPTKSITTTTTINKLSESFATHGLPDVIVSDNGTQFTSENFKNFCLSRGIVHIRTSPFHPQSNGQAERMVDTFKRALKKMEGEEEDIFYNINSFLFSYRSTPNRSAPQGKSPAEILIGRKFKTLLDLALPQAAHSTVRNEAMEKQFNIKHGAIYRNFEKGELVYAKVYKDNKSFWKPGVITTRFGNVNYDVKLDKGKTIRSHANQINPRTGATDSSLFELFDTFDISATDEAEIGTKVMERNSLASSIGEENASSVVERPIRVRRPPVKYDPYRDVLEAKRGGVGRPARF